jgi:cytochrome b6-f complex iron-sulfur subunit
MPERKTLADEVPPSRRQFLKVVGDLSFIAGFAGICASTLRFLSPNVLYEPPAIFFLGPVDDFPPDSVTFLEEDRIFVFRKPEGFYAVSSICTHLGCNVRWNIEELRFKCPCHGSVFDRNGKNIAGPAPRPLKWYDLSLSSDRRLLVNTHKEVTKDFRLKV